MFELTVHFKHEMIGIWLKISKKLQQIKWNLINLVQNKHSLPVTNEEFQFLVISGIEPV